MDKQLESSDEKLNPNLVITITMKKMESYASSGAGSSDCDKVSNDTNNNDSVVVKTVKKESAAKEFCKNLFNKTMSSSGCGGDKNNNSPAPPVTNQYTKMTIDGLMSQFSLHQNRNIMSQLTTQQQQQQQQQQGSAITTTQQNDASKRYNPTQQAEKDDTDENARIQRALEIQHGIEVTCDSSSLSSSTPSMLSRIETLRQESCDTCHPKQFGTAQCTIPQLPNADVEVPKYHSQDFYCHFLVPDLEKITSCCYYWGKMDRYEAERLLEGKPEGTFLLRDSAQDDYLFSVSFRKYGRSLHARIEQWNHKFSFDSHDPSVYTAPTVTGLVEHYKDPSSVMFFEPMLTSPLHRNYVFSLEQLCRAAIVSHTTYDGINDLCLPPAMKSYLKEYHYKLKLRIKQGPEQTNLSSS